MSSAQRHLVRAAVFEVEEAPPGGTVAMETFPGWVRRALLPVAEEVFDEVADPERLLRIDRLELELGPLDPGDPTGEMVNRFRQALRDALRRRVDGSGPSTTPPTPPDEARLVRSGAEADAGALAELLRVGDLPWWADPGAEGSPGDLARRVVAAGSPLLRAALGGRRPTRLVLERFVRQADDPTLGRAFRTLGGGGWAGRLERFLAASRRAGASPGAVEAMRCDVAVAVLDALLRGRNPATVGATLRGGGGRAEAVPAAWRAGAEALRREALQALRAALAGDPGAVADAWWEARAVAGPEERSEAVREALAQVGPFRDRVLRSVPTAVYLDWVDLLAPGNAPTVAAELLREARRTGAGDPAGRRRELLDAATRRAGRGGRRAPARGPGSGPEPPASVNAGAGEAPSAARPFEHPLERALRTAGSLPAEARLFGWLRTDPRRVAGAIRRRGRTVEARRSMVRSWGDEALVAVARALDPIRFPRIVEILEAPGRHLAAVEAGARASGGLRDHLWEASLAFLVFRGEDDAPDDPAAFLQARLEARPPVDEALGRGAGRGDGTPPPTDGGGDAALPEGTGGAGRARRVEKPPGAGGSDPGRDPPGEVESGPSVAAGRGEVPPPGDAAPRRSKDPGGPAGMGTPDRSAGRTPGPSPGGDEDALARPGPVEDPVDSGPPPRDLPDRPAHGVAALLRALAGGRSVEAGTLVRALDRAVERDRSDLLSVLEEGLGSEAVRRALADLLGPEARSRLLRFLRPGPGTDGLLEAARLLGRAAHPFVEGDGEAAGWAFLMEYMVGEGRWPEPGAWARAFLRRVAGVDGVDGAGERDEGDPGSRAAAVRARLAAMEGSGGDAGRIRSLLDATAGSSLPRPSRPDPGGDGGDAWVENAGLVLVAPFLPRLFGTLGLLDGRSFRGPAASERAAHLLQHLVEERADRPEHLLVLNKLLCGVGPDRTLPRSIEVTPAEDEEIRSLLRAVIEHWSALGNTSIEGLRTSFLHRPGRLSSAERAWRLQVEDRAFDVLLDRIPWAYGIVRLPWMDRPLHVDWR